MPTANGKHASCCAVVHGLQRNLFVVPREDVSTPEIAALEERLESDPGARAALIPLLHVRRVAAGVTASSTREQHHVVFRHDSVEVVPPPRPR